MPGPLPKETRQRPNDTKRRQAEYTVLHQDGVVRGPDLVGTYTPETLAWYDGWRVSAQAQLFTETDWQTLQRLAVAVDAVNRNPARPSASLLSEIRLTEERFGATLADRQRLRIRVEESEAAEVVTLHAVETSRESIRARLKGDAD